MTAIDASAAAVEPRGDLLDGLHRAVDLIASGDPLVVSTTLRTLRVAVEATAIAALVGVPAGCLLGVGRFRGRRALLVVANTLIRVPPVAVGLLVVLALTQDSAWGGGPLAGLHWFTTFNSVYLAQTLLAVPILVALTASAVQGTSPGLLEQARAFGAPGWRRGVLALREARTAIIAAALVALGVTITTVGAILVSDAPLNYAGNAPATLATGALTAFTENGGGYDTRPLAVAYATVLVGLFLMLAAALTRLQQQRATWIAGRPS